MTQEIHIQFLRAHEARAAFEEHVKNMRFDERYTQEQRFEAVEKLYKLNAIEEELFQPVKPEEVPRHLR